MFEIQNRNIFMTTMVIVFNIVLFHTVFVRNPVRNMSLERTKRRRNTNIKMELKDISWKGMDCVDLD
jgi:hypothetical protein